MNKGLKITLWILGIGALVGVTVYTVKQIKKASDVNGDDDAKKAEEEVIAAAVKSGKATVKPKTSGTSTPPVVSTTPNIAGKVSDAVLKYEDKELIGKKIYAGYDGQTAYDTVNNVYTKPSKGQLLGVFAFSKPLTVGGKNVYIKTTDPKNPYIYMRADFLTF